jgi:succinylglutamate desuccinylase
MQSFLQRYSFDIESLKSMLSLICFTLSFPVVAASLSGSMSTIRNVVVVGGTHGNEYTGVWCIKALDRAAESLSALYPSLRISTLLANPEAYRQNKRFVDEDLNRQFSENNLMLRSMDGDNLPRTVESLRAHEINEMLGPKFSDSFKTDVIVDLHSTTSNMGLTLIIAEGDSLMAAAAAYVLLKCGGEARGARCLMHSHPSRESRPNLSSAARHGFTIEVGPVPQGILRHDAVERTQQAVAALLEFLQLHNQDRTPLLQNLRQAYHNKKVPCFRSAPARRPGEMSGKITWPCDSENVNFPAVMVHKDLQDRDFHEIQTGDPLFVDLKGKTIPYTGSHGSPVYLMFVNEGGYYYASSGTGIGVAIRADFNLESGKFVEKITVGEYDVS